MNGKKEITILDIARDLNVAPYTVSRALKDHPSISAETKEAVKVLASKKGFKLHGIEFGPQTNRGKNIGVLISKIDNPFVAALVSGIEMEAKSRGYQVILSQSHDEYLKEVANTQTLIEGRIEGLVASLAMETRDYLHFQRFIEKDIPMVFVDQVVEHVNCDLVMIDNYAAGYAATQHLIDQGCRRIAHIGGRQNRKAYRDRQKGYVQALIDHGIQLEERLIVESNTLSAEEGTASASFLLNLPAPPDGVFAANDTSAVSVIQYAKSKKIKVPQELAVVGFNNDLISMVVEPNLSTVSHPAMEMGRLAARKILMRNSQKRAFPSSTTIFKTEVLTRESSCRSLV